VTISKNWRVGPDGRSELIDGCEVSGVEVFCERSESTRALHEIRDLFGIGAEAESKL
jgi:hypothetical protein